MGSDGGGFRGIAQSPARGGWCTPCNAPLRCSLATHGRKRKSLPSCPSAFPAGPSGRWQESITLRPSMLIAGGGIMRGVRRGLRTIRAGLMAGVCLGTVNAHAGDATWAVDAPNNNWNDGANWTSSPPHVVPDGTATFAPSSKTTIVLGNAGNTAIDNITFAQTAPAYTIAIGAGQGLSVNGSGAGGGVSNNSFFSPVISLYPELGLDSPSSIMQGWSASRQPTSTRLRPPQSLLLMAPPARRHSTTIAARVPRITALSVFLAPRSTTTLAAQPNFSRTVLPTSRTSQTRATGPSYSSTRARPAVPVLRMLQGGK